jgi:two-component sensor histidine kinase
VGSDIGKAIPGCELAVDAPRGFLIDTDQAVPLALLVNELITNSAKYAYPGKACRVWLKIAQISSEEVLISVRDEGVGLAPDFDLARQKGLGMRIVSAFATQLGGELRFHRRNPGTEVTLTFRPRPTRKIQEAGTSSEPLQRRM